MLRTRYAFLIFCVFIASYSCKGKGRNVNNAIQADTLRAGMLQSLVRCQTADYSYALYLPSNYDVSKKWPVIFCFDPQADGSIPLRLCMTEAEKYGYILVGSNDSRNGLSFPAVVEIFNALLNDVSQRFSVNKARMQLMGFSGGARVAGLLAMTRTDICALVGCSAGLQDFGQPLQKPFDYLGVAGMADMNYLEMKLLFDKLDESPLPHFLLLFDGKHTWPPDSVVPEIFHWLQLKAMKKKMIETDNDYIAEVLGTWQGELVVARQEKDILQEEYVCLKALHFLEGFPQARTFEKELSAVRSRSDYAPAVKKSSEILRDEQDAQLQYSADLISKDLVYWKKEAEKMAQKEKSASTREEKNMVQRLSGYLSLSAYSAMNRSMQASAWDAANHYNKVYALVDPDNPEHAYVAAKLAMRNGEEKEAIRSLQQAIELGFKDAGRLENDTSFTSLRGKAEFIETMKKLKGGPGN